MQKRAFQSRVHRHYTGQDTFRWMASPESTREVHKIWRLKVTDTSPFH